MAFVRYTPMVASVSGAVGDTTYKRTKYGNLVHQKIIPIQPNTQIQLDARSAFAQAAAAWDTITPTQRTAWDLYAQNTQLQGTNGEEFTPEGRIHFIRTNAALLNIGKPLQAAAPTLFGLPSADSTFAAAISAGTQQISATFLNTQAWAGEVGGHMLVYMSQPQKASNKACKGRFRYAGKIDGAVTPPTSPRTIACPYTVTSGQKCWVEYRVLRADGRISNSFRVSCTVAS